MTRKMWIDEAEKELERQTGKPKKPGWYRGLAESLASGPCNFYIQGYTPKEAIAEELSCD